MIEDLIKKHEGKTLEFKENTNNLKGILKTIVAFANTAGGVIVIGIKDKSKNIIGVSDPLNDEEKLANTISDSISPLIIPGIEICSYKNKQLLIIRIPHMVGPYYINNKSLEDGVFIRFGSTNRKADAEIIKSLKLLAENKTFDELPSIRGDIDENYLKTIFKKVKKNPSSKQYHMLGIYTDHFGKTMPTVGGVLLSSKEHTFAYPDSIIRCACFQGTNKEKILDHIDILSPLPSAVDEITIFIQRNTRKEAVIGTTRRVDIPEYPPKAVRELIINALIHTDYSLKGAHIQIAIFSDRIEITNPGGLPFGQTMKKALSGYSRLRNHVIGRVFRELELIEQWGSGLRRIHELCKKRGLKPPIFEEEGNHFRSIIFSQKLEEATLSVQEQKLVDYLKQHKTIQTQQAAKLWKISDRATRTRLTKMIQEGLIVRISTSEKDPQAVFVLQDEKIV